MLTIGIDIGSVTTKGVLMSDGALVQTASRFTGYSAEKAAWLVYGEILGNQKLSKSDVKGIVATGYGRNSVPFADRAVTEILCHAAGAYHCNPAVRAVIDIGGQDSKAIIVSDEGKVANFIMNDKCAAGTGRFLEVMARALEVDLDRFGELSLQAGHPSRISSLVRRVCGIGSRLAYRRRRKKGKHHRRNPRRDRLPGCRDGRAFEGRRNRRADDDRRRGEKQRRGQRAGKSVESACAGVCPGPDDGGNRRRPSCVAAVTASDPRKKPINVFMSTARSEKNDRKKTMAEVL